VQEGKGGLKNYPWEFEYRTSAQTPDGRAVDILRDFYVPALERSVDYRRVAGYFTSSSLAAAAQGFSVFTSSGGRMRLIAGADIAPEDVAAVLAGEEERLSRILEERLEDRSWPEEVRRGVELLGWMVARGVLEVRVAVRVHAGTGKGLPFDSMADGYVHEKWAIFEDAFGDALLASGSLNESRTALVLNAENISVDAGWWEGPSPKRVARAKRDFDLLWENKNPHLRIFTLPEAVRLKLVSLGVSAPPLRAKVGVPAQTARKEPSFREWLAFRTLQLAPRMPGGLWLGMESAPVEPWPHQRVVARRLVESYPAGFLLCDEVGLGKTIEAGLAFRSLLLSGAVSRILIAPPAGLGRQWLREMAEKFFLPFKLVASATPTIKHEALYPEFSNVRSASLFEPDLCIVSTGLLVRPERRSDIERTPPFDVVLMDEAHAARRSNSSAEDGCRTTPEYNTLYNTLRDLLLKKTRSLWLATATPVQLDWIEAYDLFRLFGRTGAFDASPSLVRGYYDLLGAFCDNVGPNEGEWSFLRGVLKRVQFEDPMYWRTLVEGMLSGRLKRCVEDWLSRNRTPRPNDFIYLRRLLFAMAPLSRVMLRHTRKLLAHYRERGELKANLARRVLLPPPEIAFSEREKEVYDDLQRYCAELKRLLGGNKKGNDRVSLGFYLSFLRQRFASSFFALAESLRRRLEKVEATLAQGAAGTAPGEYDSEEQDDDVESFSDQDALERFLKNRSADDLEWERGRLMEMIGRLRMLKETPSKILTLLRTLEKRREGDRLRQTVLFTRYMDTLTEILRHLRSREAALRIGVYSGKRCEYFDASSGRRKGTDREGVKRRFLRGEIDLLLCTDAAAEGLNLQTADLLINFDLPWNPMKVEQRIGRIDRIGQKHDEIHVLNMCVLGSVEEAIYERLLQRLHGAMNLMGSLDFSLLPVQPDEFERFASGELTEAELEREARDRLERQKRRIAGMEMSPDEQYDVYTRLSEKTKGEVRPATLERAWKTLLTSGYLRALGCSTIAGYGDSVLQLSGVPGIPDGTCLTADRELYDRGIEGAEGTLHFASWGDGVFDALLEHVVAARSDTGCVRTVSCALPHRTVCALAVRGAENGVLVAGLDDVREDIGESVASEPFSSEETAAFEEELGRQAKLAEESVLFARAEVVQRTERINGNAAWAENLLELQLSLSMLDSVRALDFDDDAPFRSVIDYLETCCEEKESIFVTSIPVEILRSTLEESLWNFPVPSSGSKASLQVPAMLCRALLNVCCREADALKKKKSATTLAMVKNRLSRRVAEASG